MNKDDDNYELMVEKRTVYMQKAMESAYASGVEVTNWEKDEIELAFEAAFAVGYNLGFQAGRNRRTSAFSEAV